MECKFLQHGLAIDYYQTVKPCCVWHTTDSWREINFVNKVDLISWNRSPTIQNFVSQFKNNEWPDSCSYCKRTESNGRNDSMRGNGNRAYSHYDPDDITLEIRPGNTCNFACQTCWPAASSRVSQYQLKAGIIDKIPIEFKRNDNFDYLLPIAHRIKNVVLLGGEPFYDKNCLAFLAWAEKNLNADLIVFTNGSMVNYDFIKNYQGKLDIVFSLDAAGRSAEYIRYGTEWDTVIDNYFKTKHLDNVNVRVNITCSIYNYAEIRNLIKILAQDWPSILTFGEPNESWFREGAIPIELRPDIIDSLGEAVDLVKSLSIKSGQRANAINALEAIKSNLKNLPWDPLLHKKFCDFAQSMDTVKQISAAEYVPTLGKILSYKPNQI